MNIRQQHRRARLCSMGYRPEMMGYHTDGSVRVVVAKKLDKGALPLLITPDGGVKPWKYVNRPH